MPADADFVAVGNFKTIIESAGGSLEEGKFTLPSFAKDKMKDVTDDEDYQVAVKFLKKCGADVDACAVTGNFYDNVPVFIVALNDEEKFVAALKSEGFSLKETEEGVAFYALMTYESTYSAEYNDYCYVGVYDGFAYAIADVSKENANKTMRIVKNMIDESAETSFADTPFCDYITSGNAAGIAIRMPGEVKSELKENGVSGDMLDMYGGVVCFKGDLTKNVATFSMKCFDEEGNEKDMTAMKKYIDLSAKISADALAYMGKDEVLVYAASIKDVNWDDYLDMVAEVSGMRRSERAALIMAKSYLEKLNGTVAMGLGVKNGMQSFTDIEDDQQSALTEVSVTMVCEVKEGKANGLINDIKALLDAQNLAYSKTSDGLAILMPGEGSSKFYISAKDDILIMSNQKIAADNNPVVKNVNFGDYFAAGGLFLSKNNALMKDFGIKNDLKVSVGVDGETLETTAVIEMEGDDQAGIIGTLIKAAFKVADKLDEISRAKYDTSYDGPDYFEPEEWADSAATDSIALP